MIQYKNKRFALSYPQKPPCDRRAYLFYEIGNHDTGITNQYRQRTYDQKLYQTAAAVGAKAPIRL